MMDFADVRKVVVLRIVLSLAAGYLVLVLLFWYTELLTDTTSTEYADKDQSFAQPKTQVVIVGYMRSGSSLTGNIIQHHPSVFYVFEPLHDLVLKYTTDMEQQFPNFRFRSERPLMSIKPEVQQLFRAWFTCDFDFILQEEYRYHISFFKLGHKTKLLMECLNRTTNTSFRYTQKCTGYLRKQCEDSSYSVIKTIRTPLHWLYELILQFPNLKLVHLVRDPRALIVSQRQYGECMRKNGGVVGCSKFLCSSMEDDLTSFLMIEKLFPNRITRLKYEDLANDPIETSRNLYDFLNLTFADKTEKYVMNITMSGLNSNNVLDTVRPNARYIVDKWRSLISNTELEIVQTICKHVMRELSYHHFIRPI